MLTAERARELFEYDPESGRLRWKIDRGRCKCGDEVGCLSTIGYRKTIVDYKYYLVHRIIWLVVIGDWPRNQIDHIDGNRSNNKWINLREATQSQNNCNTGPMKRKSNPLKGAYYHKKISRWFSSIRQNKKSIFLGTFDTPEEAHKAYCRAAQQFYGEFARTK